MYVLCLSVCPKHCSRSWGYSSELMILKSLPLWSLYSDRVWGIQIIPLLRVLLSILVDDKCYG